MFIYWKNEEGIDELVTPPADNLILHGVIRDSVLVLKILIFYVNLIMILIEPCSRNGEIQGL